LVIAASFITSAPLGIVTTLAIALHEVPQELGDFGVLVYAGFKKTRAFAFNFLTAVLAVAGGIFGYLLSIYSESIATFLLPFAAGGFIYIAASDLIPEIKREPNLKKSLFNLLIFSAGILIIYSMRFLGVH